MNHRLTVTAAAATVLASTALYPLVANLAWLWAGLGAAVVVAATGTLTRLRMLPAVICLLATLASLLAYLNLVFAGRQSLFRVVPTLASLHHLIWLAGRATAEMAKYAPPVPASRGITLLATAGIGLVAAVTDLIGVRLRRPAIAGLPLLVLFCVPLSIDADPGGPAAVLVFCLGVTGYLALLSADGRERVRLWGRLVRPQARGAEPRGPDTRQLTAAGRRIGFAAVVLALCVPLLLPGLRHHRLLPGTHSGQGQGPAVSVPLPDPLVQMNAQLHEARPETVLTYHSDSPITPPYLQIYVLAQLGTGAWYLSPPAATAPLGTGPLPAVPGLKATTPGQTVHEQISLGPILRDADSPVSYLPVPYAPRSVSVPGAWRVDPSSLTILTTGTQLAGLRYRVTSTDVDPAPAQLRAAPVPPASENSYLQVPGPFRVLSQLARRVTAGQTSAYGRAVALQQWFTVTGKFTYTLNAPQPRDASALISFLTKTRRGYCQQFAFAMAVMARLLGIPSRVVVGYTQGSYIGNDIWQVRTSDAHAWPELYFAGAGWLRFEPTPAGVAGQPGQATATAPVYSFPSAGGRGTVPKSTPSAPGNAGSQPTASSAPGGLSPKLRHLPRAGGGGGRPAPDPFLAGLAVLAVLAAAAAVPRAARSARRRHRWFRAGDDAGRAQAAWDELRDDLTDHRIACRASESPRGLAHRLGPALGLTGPQRGALERIATAAERAQYAASPVPSTGLAADVVTVRKAVARSCRLGTRWNAVLLPASTLAPARAALQNALDVFGWMDLITGRLHRRTGQAATSVPAALANRAHPGQVPP
jgi:transglutaminase-like putative cysteine protease